MKTDNFKTYQRNWEHVPTSDMEQDEPGIINIAGPSTKVDILKKEKACVLFS